LQNTDVSARGSFLRVSAAPLLEQVIRNATSSVLSPNQTIPGQTVHDVWDGVIRTMGSGSDFTAFQDFAGVPSVDIGFDVGPGAPVYHYHSNYDSFHWMSEFADKGFLYHRAMAQVIGVMAAKLADQPVIPFRAVDYAKALDRYIKQIEDKLEKALSPQTLESGSSFKFEDLDDDTYFALRASTSSNLSLFTTSSHSADSFRNSLANLREKALHRFTHRAKHLDRRADRLIRHFSPPSDDDDDKPWWRRWLDLWLPHRILLARELRRVNTRYKLLERAFLYEKGLDGRSWFKHVVFAPGLWTGYAGAVFPGLVESIDARDWKNAERWVRIIGERIEEAARGLEF
jgi:N-acetylated-alpha-linked acidic dipeptidase